MRVLFWGDVSQNNGPANINKGLVKCGSAFFVFVKAKGKYRRMLCALWNVMGSDAVVVSGVGRQQCIVAAAANALGKKSLYLMHGCNEQEYKINEVAPDRRGLAYEAFLMKKAHIILTVSRRYRHWFCTQYPQYAHKTDYIYNGVDRELFAKPCICQKESGAIAVAGGTSLRKNNIVVARAVERLEGRARLRVYGGEGGMYPEDFHHTEWVGTVENQQFLSELSRSEIFVLNSRQESFSIATLEALACGCSLLVSECAGVSDLLALEETDIIHDPMDEEELYRKMAYLLEHPNHQRLYAAFRVEEWSFEKMASRLEEKCRVLLDKKTIEKEQRR